MESSINWSMTSMDGGLDLQHCSGSRAKRSRHQMGCQSVYLELLHPTGHNLRFVENPHFSNKNKSKKNLGIIYVYVYTYVCNIEYILRIVSHF